MLELAATPLLALAADRLLGEPPARWHPVVWMGRYLGWAGARLAPRAGAPRVLSDRRVFWGAALTWCAAAAAVFALAWLLQRWLLAQPAWLALPALALGLKPQLAWALLRSEVQAVESALAVSLDAGRERLAWLVSRDVRALDAAAVRESAIESLAENLNDSVVAPLLWFALLGLPGAALYRFANTADAMWGYRGERGGHDWTCAGKWAARADDLLSWLPARITALLLALAALRWPRTLAREAARTPSPNSGWPMAAAALLLGVRLGKPGVYVLNAAGAVPRADDTRRAIVLAGRAAWLAGLACTAVLAAAGGWATA